MDKYPIDREMTLLKPIKFKRYSIYRRMTANLVLKLIMFFTKPKQGIRRRHYHIRGHQHSSIKIKTYERKDQIDPTPAILYIHGGGFQIEGTPIQLNMLMNMVHETGYKAFYVHYRLAPKFPFPTGFYDCYHALQWMTEHHDHLNIYHDQIIVAGDSAGGNLATAVALYARDHQGPKIIKQMLLYPVLDIRQDTSSMKAYHDTPVWNNILNKAMWEAYIKDGDHGMLPYASPSLAEVHDMPETYIETAQFDCLRDEAIEYARRLSEAGVSVIEHHTRGTVHGYDAIFFGKLMKEMMRNRIAFLKGTNHENH